MKYNYHKIPQTRIASFDVFSVGLLKHHVSALLEFDVTDGRERLKVLKKAGKKVSFNAWLIKVISKALEQHREATGYIFNKRKLMIFDDINISIMVEKELEGKKVPIPLVIEKANEKNIEEITQEIEDAKKRVLSDKDIVLQKRSAKYERLYYHLPGFLRRMVWRLILNHPKIAFKKMGNVIITSPGMMGKINGWFIQKSIHPVSFGMGSVIKKPVVIDDEIRIREILNMTILLDHDALDGAPMVRFMNDLTRLIGKGDEL